MTSTIVQKGLFCCVFFGGFFMRLKNHTEMIHFKIWGLKIHNSVGKGLDFVDGIKVVQCYIYSTYRYCSWQK